MFQKFEYKDGRTFVVGDIHGEFELLEDILYKIGFDRSVDHLFSVGDLVDRGPASHLAREYIQQPWFHAVRGNHEQMVLDAGGTFWHVQNGGAWWNELDEKEQARVRAAFNALPCIIQFESPSGKQIGIVHAGFEPRKWTNLEAHVNKCENNWKGENPLLWDREQIRATPHHSDEAFTVEGIDHIYFGHTPIKQPLTKGNMTWIDTGAFATKNLTVLEIE